MTRSLLLVSLAAGSLTVPVPAAYAATEPAIRSITVRPADPVVGAQGSIRLVIDVIVKGARGKDGVTVKVEPGSPPEQPLPDAAPAPVHDPAWPPAPVQPGREPADYAGQAPVQGTGRAPAQPPRAPAQAHVLAPGQYPAHDSGLTPAHATLPPWEAAPDPGAGTMPSLPEDMQPAGDAELEWWNLAKPKIGVPAGDARSPIPPRLVWRQVPVPPARMADGWQTWRFLPDKRLNRYYPAGTWTIAATAKGRDGSTVTEYASFDLKRETRLSSVRAEKSAAADGVRVHGSLTRVDPRGLTDFGPFAKQRLELLWRPETASAWEKVGEATTDASGAFVGTIGDRTEGQWRVRYPGTTHYASDISKARQITQ